MRNERIAILGGGVAGVVAAQSLAADGNFDVVILEQADRLGGLQHSREIDGAVYDIGAFVFDAEHALLRAFPALYDSFVTVPHLSYSLTRHGTLDKYPMTMRGYLRDNGIPHCVRAGVDLLVSKVVHRRRDTLVSFVKYYLGSAMYERSGLKSYIERFYSTRDTNIDLEFARQRLLPLQHDCALRKNLARIIRDARNKNLMDKPWACYVRSPEGFGHAYGIIRDDLENRGVDIRLGYTVDRIRRDAGGFVIDGSAGAERFDRVVSTIPVPVAAGYMGLPVHGAFETMSLVSLFYRLDGDYGFRSSYLYNFTGGGKWKRLTMFSDYYGRCRGEHYFVVECTVRGTDHRNIAEQRAAFERHIATMPVLRGNLKYQDGLLTRDAYPFYRRGDTERMAHTKRLLADAGLYLAGRQGGFDYLTSHATAERSARIAGQLMRDAAA